MRFTLKTLCLLFLASRFVYAEAVDECAELKAYLEEKFSADGYECTSNKDGKIDKLYVKDEGLEKEDFEKIQSYETITDLSIYLFSYINHKLEVKEEFNYLTNLKNLKNLKKLDINYYVYNNPCTTLCHIHHLAKIGSNTFKDLPNLKNLSVFGISLTQENIDEISTLKNLETLNLDYCSFEGIDFKSLSNLKKVTRFSATANDNGYDDAQDESVPSELINSFSSLKELHVSKSDSIDYKKFTEMEILEVDYLDTSVLLNYPNLKTLSIDPGNDLSVLEKVDSLENLYISFEPASHGYASFPYQDLNIKFSENSNLEFLYFHGVRFDSSNLDEILKLKNIKKIIFDQISTSDDDENDVLYKLKSLENRCPLEVTYDYFWFDEIKSFKNDQCNNVTSVSGQPEPTITSVSGQPEPTITSVSSQPEPTITSVSSQPEPTITSVSSQPEPTITSISGQPEPTVHSHKPRPTVHSHKPIKPFKIPKKSPKKSPKKCYNVKKVKKN